MFTCLQSIFTLLLLTCNAPVLGGKGTGNDVSCWPSQFTNTAIVGGFPGTMSILYGLHTQLSVQSFVSYKIPN